MASKQKAEPVEQVAESESACYLRIRAEAKAEAAVTVAAEAKAAQEAKAARLKAASSVPGQDKFLKSARDIEARINGKGK